jgi:arylsulfatase A-like enzyme
LSLFPVRGPTQAQSTELPNILWITVEDMSPRLGAYGDSVALTPNIDRLAAEGMRFTHAFTTAGVCSPSRAAIFTGMYQTSIGAHHMRVTHEAPGLPTPYLATPPPFVKGFTEYLRGAGYYAANYGKTDYQVAAHPRDPVTAWDESVGYEGDATVEPVWRQRPAGQPFFIVLNTMRTHESRVWPDSTEPRRTDAATVSVPPYYPDSPVVREDIARHYDNIARMDAWVGTILDQLAADGLAENTIVFFWSDHGDGLPRAKRWPYDSGIHVPLVVRWPGQIQPGTVNDELVSLVDLAPTVLALGGATIPGHLHGRVLLGDRAETAPEYIFAARDRMDESYDRVRAVRDARFKYIRNYFPEKPYILWLPYRNRMPTMQVLLRLKADGSAGEPVSLWLRDRRDPEELYDIVADPHEVNNLADDPEYRPFLERMSDALTAWQTETGDMGHIAESQMVHDMWPGGMQPMTAAPVFLVNTSSLYQQRIDSSSTLAKASTIELHSPTQGASIAWTTDTGDNPHWKLYSGLLRFDQPVTVRAVAVRYGFAKSEEVSLVITSEAK